MARPKAPNGMFTCCVCGEFFPKEEKIVVSGKSYCKKCGKELQEEAENYKKLSTYIYETIYDKDCNMPLITTQIRRLRQEFEEMTYTRLLRVLQYAIDIEKVNILNLDPNWGIYNLITRYYYDAKKYYDLKASISREISKAKKQSEPEPKIIHIKRSDIIKQQEEFEEERRKEQLKLTFSKEDFAKFFQELEESGTREKITFFK